MIEYFDNYIIRNLSWKFIKRNNKYKEKEINNKIIVKSLLLFFEIKKYIYQLNIDKKGKFLLIIIII